MLRFSIAMLVAATGTATALPATAQETITICETQQELEQVIGSDGSIMPDACRTMTISTLTADGVQLCYMDFSSDGGVLGALRDAAAPAAWWARCDQLAAAIP
jgi:hypothetical protein